MTSPRNAESVPSTDGPLVGIVVGSESDRELMQPAIDELEGRGIAHEFEVRSAHRQPDAVAEYARSARARWLEVELAALDAWTEIGAIPAGAAQEVRSRVHVPTPERVAEIERSTDHDTAAFVDAVTEQVGPEGRWVHFGLTSSDVVDTGL